MCVNKYTVADPGESPPRRKPNSQLLPVTTAVSTAIYHSSATGLLCEPATTVNNYFVRLLIRGLHREAAILNSRQQRQMNPLCDWEYPA